MKNDKRQMENDKCSFLLKFPIPYVSKMTFDRSGGGHHRTDKMCAAATSLTTLEIAIARRGATLARLQDVGIHSQTHRASGLAPFKTRITEDPIETFALRFFLH